MTPEEVLASLQTIARMQLHINQLEQALGAAQAQDRLPDESQFMERWAGIMRDHDMPDAAAWLEERVKAFRGAQRTAAGTMSDPFPTPPTGRSSVVNC